MIALLVAALGVAAACGGGGGGDGQIPAGDRSGDAGPTTAPGTSADPPYPGEGSSTDSGGGHSLLLSWHPPTTRANGAPLAPDEIQGYVVVFFRLGEGDNARGWLEGRLPDLAAFRMRGEQMGAFVSGRDVAEMVTAGSPHTVIVSPGEIPYRLEGLSAGTYYIAVSCFDWDGRYASLSNTARAVRP